MERTGETHVSLLLKTRKLSGLAMSLVWAKKDPLKPYWNGDMRMPREEGTLSSAEVPDGAFVVKIRWAK